MENYFTLYNLPVSFSPDPVVVKQKYYELSRQYHPDKFANAGSHEHALALRIAAMNNDAYKTLRDADATMAYVLRIAGVLEEEEKYQLPAAFLMEMMDLNEAISDYEDDTTNTKARETATATLKEQMDEWETATNRLKQQYSAGAPNPALLAQLKDMYMRKKYLLRIADRLR